MSSADRCAELNVDLEQQTITSAAGKVVAFEVEEFRRHCLLNGLDDIALTLQKADDIDAYEQKIAALRPWV
jgi:3-isopropylmalate/(R)-2-methylmalate dehydratase small subunit